MNTIAQKFIRKSIKTIEIDGISFTFRKLNPTDNFIINKSFGEIKKKGLKKLVSQGQSKEDAEENFKYTSDDIQAIGNIEIESCFTRCVLEPKIVLKEFGDPSLKKDEVPLSLIDAGTSIKLLDAIQEFSLELWEDVSVKKFPGLGDGTGSNGNVPDIKSAPEHLDEELQSGNRSIPTDEDRQNIRKSSKRRRKSKDRSD